MSAARGPYARLLLLVTMIGVAGWHAGARAGESADRGISLAASVGGALDRSVTATNSGDRVNETAPIFGGMGVGNIERVAIGGAIDATPGVLGNGRLSLGALLGYQQQFGRSRLHLLGEAGGHRFSQVGGTLLGRQLGPDKWLPYAGARLGIARTVPAHGFIEIGAWLFGRYDLGQTMVTNVSSSLGEETRTDYRLGGFMTGVALQIGIRLESPHPWNQGVVEP
jgi:hypothetical protein